VKKVASLIGDMLIGFGHQRHGLVSDMTKLGFSPPQAAGFQPVRSGVWLLEHRSKP